MARDSLSRRYTIDSAFRISISGAAASIQSLDTGFPPRHRSLAFRSATPSFAVALVLYRFIRILMANSLPLALLSTWMVLAHSSPASLMATYLTVSLSTPDPVLDAFGHRTVPSSTPPLRPAASRPSLPSSPPCFHPTSVPATANIMHCHFVFAIKRKADGSIDKFKARLVADGNTQKHGVDFNRVFATVVKALTIRLVLAIAAARDYNLTSLDIRQAYLQATIYEDLYMRVPPGINSGNNSLVCKLRRSLYGLKQAGREWGLLLTSFLVSWGFVRSTIDVCLYTYQSGNLVLWVLVYVDDILIADNCSKLRARFVADISKRFPTEDKGELEWILNTAITRDRAARTLNLSQALYAADLVAKYSAYLDRSRSRRFDSPMEEGLELSAADQPAVGSVEHDEMSEFRTAYMAIVGGLLWLANMTRVDIAYSASQLARFMTNPGPPHFKAAIRVLIYVRDTTDRALSRHAAEPRPQP